MATTTDRDTGLAATIRAHHRHLEAELGVQVDAIVRAAREGQPPDGAVADLLTFLATEIVPHARAEEDELYAAVPGSDPFVAGMVFEHEAILDLGAELAATTTATDAAAAAAALRAVFHGHVRRENELLLPALMADPSIDFPRILAGMERRFGIYQAAAR